MRYLFTSESVSEGHPDKVCDAISDAVLDALLRQDKYSRVACECFVTTGLVMIGGEITTNAYVDFQTLARETVREIGYTKAEYKFDADSCSVNIEYPFTISGHCPRGEHRRRRRPGNDVRLCQQ